MSSFVTLSDARDAAALVYNESAVAPTGWMLDTTFGLVGRKRCQEPLFGVAM